VNASGHETHAVPQVPDDVGRRHELAPWQEAALPPALPGRGGIRLHTAPDSLRRPGTARTRP
jgi:hypothetical protein